MNCRALGGLNRQDSAARESGDEMPHVLIVGSRTLLDQSVASLLITEVDLQVSSVTYRTEDEFIQTIAELRPEVIVISETDGSPVAQIVDVINRHAALSSCRVIVVQSDSNTLKVCDRVTASRSEDLLRLIRSNSVTMRHQ